MGSKIWAVVNWGILVVVTLIAVWMVWGLSTGEVEGGESESSGECLDIGKLDNFEYEACYDATSQMIFLKASREKSEYKVNELKVSFVDLSSQSYVLTDVPSAGGEKAYRIGAKKNPKNMDIRLEVVHDFAQSVCGAAKVFVDYCPAGTGGEGVDVSISPIDGVGIKDFIEIEDMEDVDSDIVVMDLVERESIWESTCKSDWNCGEWEACVEGVQHRTCKDTKGCSVPTSSPISAQRCDGACVESWECEWSSCEDGYSTPDCSDLNGCGTSYSIPEKLFCDERGSCVPEVICGAWTTCDINYDFVDLIGVEGLAELTGSKSRVCTDDKGCVSTQKEEEDCSISVDIYTERFDRCGEEYVGVYNVLDDSTLAVLKEGTGDKNYLNIYFDDKDGVYCDYCFDGVQDGDESGVDCGGSCKDCSERYVEERSWWEVLF